MKSLREEILEVREMLEEERRARGSETADLAAQVQELRHAKQQRFEEVDSAIEEMKADMLLRFRNLQVRMEKVVADTNARFEKLEAQVEADSIDHKGMVQAVSKRMAQEASQWRTRADIADRDIKDHKSQAEVHVGNSRRRHEDLREEVERIAVILRDNTMARDPFRHFSAKPMLRPLSASPSALSTATPLTSRSTIFERSSVGSTNGESPHHRGLHS